MADIKNLEATAASSDDERPLDKNEARFLDAENNIQIDPDHGLTPEEAKAADKKLLWKLDLMLLPWLTLLYLVSFLDRYTCPSICAHPPRLTLVRQNQHWQCKNRWLNH